MQPTQALSLAILLIQFELEEPVTKPPAPEWVRDLASARHALIKMRDELGSGAEPK